MLRRYVHSLFLTLFLLLCGTNSSLAEQLQFTLPDSIQTLKPNRHALINASAKKRLDQAYNYVDHTNFDAALMELNELINRYHNNAVVVSHGLHLAAQILSSQNELEAAIPLIQKIITLNSLENSTILDMQLLLAKIYIQTERYAASLPILNDWIHASKTSEQLANVYYLQSYAYYQLKQYKDSIESAKKGLTKKPADKTPLLSIQLNSLLELEAYSEAESVLIQLVQLKPSTKSYWDNWVNVLRRQNKNQQALASMELMQKHHPLSENDLLNYVGLLLDQNFPERAARQLEKALDSQLIEPNDQHRILLSQIWKKAGHFEKALPLQKNHY